MTPRVEAPAILSLQPRPVQTLRASLTGQDGFKYVLLIRRWRANEVGRCRLCRQCTAKAGPDRQAVCVVAVDGEAPGD